MHKHNTVAVELTVHTLRKTKTKTYKSSASKEKTKLNGAE